MWRDIKQFWGQAPSRSIGLFLGCVAVLALLTVNANLFRNTHWFLPEGIHGSKHFATLGLYTEGGKFKAVSAHELRALEQTEFRGRYFLYGPDVVDARIGGQEWKEIKSAFVSDQFFEILGIRLLMGQTFGQGQRGVVLSNAFWKEHLGSNPSILGTMIQFPDVALPILGVAPAGFYGLGDQSTDFWIPEKSNSSFGNPPIPPQSKIDPKGAREVLAEAADGFFGIVLLKAPAEAAGLREWHVTTDDAIQLTIPNLDGITSTNMLLFSNRKGSRPAVLPGLNLLPERTLAMSRHLWLVSSLSTILVILVILSMVSYWNSRATERLDEIRIRHATGARWHDLAALFALEVSPFIIGTLCISIPLAFIQLQAIQHVEPFASFFRSRDIHLVAMDFIPVFSVLGLLFLLGIAIPLSTTVSPRALRSQTIGGGVTLQTWRFALQGVQWTLVSSIAVVTGACIISGARLAAVGWGGSGNPLQVRLQWPDKQAAALDALGISRADVPSMQTPPMTRPTIKTQAYVPNVGSREPLSIYENRVATSALQLLEVPLIAGRLYTRGSESECLISQSYATLLHERPEILVGRQLIRVNPDRSEAPPLRIVGVLGDIAYFDLKVPPVPMVYFSDDHSFLGPYSLILPGTQHARLQEVARSIATSAPENAHAFSQARFISDIRNDNIHTDSVLTTATLAYASCALVMLLLGIFAEARTILAHRGREMALLIAVGARLEEASLRLLRGPMITVGIAMCLVLAIASILRRWWMPNFPFLHPADISWIILASLGIAFGFAVLLTGLAVSRIRALTLSDLLRRER